MLKKLLFVISLINAFNSFSQCDIDFAAYSFTDRYIGTGSGADVELALNNGTSSLLNFTSSQNPWNELTNSCLASGGVNDFTISIDMIQTFDVYGGNILNLTAPQTHEVRLTSTGFTGQIPMNDALTRGTSTGDVRGYKVTVTFAPHVTITSANFDIVYTSGNTAASVFESTAIEFFNKSGVKYGVAQYNGFYGSGSKPNSVSGCPSEVTGHSFVPTSAPWIRSSGTKGTFFAQSTNTVNIIDICNPTSGTNGTNNNNTVNAFSDAGLSVTDEIGGFVFYVYAEDVAGATSDFARTTTNSNTIASLRGFNISNVALPLKVQNLKLAKDNENTFLTWNYFKVENFTHFEIQFTTNGLNWQTVSLINDFGNSTFFKSNVSNNSSGFYRVIVKNNNEIISTSDFVKHINEKNIDFNLFPNPATSELNIFSKNSEDAIITFYDFAGKMVQVNLKNNDFELRTYDISFLNSGVYTCVINDKAFKFIKN